MPVAVIIGGKRCLAARIIARIEAIPHRCYAEPFVGMGGVFLRRPKRPPFEIINDINGDIVNLFRVMREHPEELIRQFDFALSSRAEYESLRELRSEALTDIQRAARFAYLQRLSARGRMGSRSFSISTTRPAGFRPQFVRRLIERAHRRLKRVHIECRDWERFIEDHDRPSTLFYLDPPYFGHGHETDYGKGIFERADFERMAMVLRNLKGRFLLSLNDRPEIRKLFQGFEREEVELNYSANYAKTPAKELLIAG